MSAENTLQAPPRSATVPRKAIDAVEQQVRQLCERYADKLPFHGWHHVSWGGAKPAGCAGVSGGDVTGVEPPARGHDVNYIVHRNPTAADGRRLRVEILARAGLPQPAAVWIDRIVREAEMAARHPEISLEAQALSDADTLFKALPVTPVVLAHPYLAVTSVSLRE